MKEYNPYNPKVPLLSIHIPKCAGSSFKEILKFWFGENLFSHYCDEKRNKPPKKYRIYKRFSKKFRSGICIHGHFNQNRGFGIEEYYPEIKQSITVIRDPFEVHLSSYFYVKKLANNAFRDGKKHPIIEGDYNLEKYLSKNKKSFILKFFPRDISLSNYQHILQERYIYIGIAEDLENSVKTLANKLNFHPPSVIPTKNISLREEEIPPGAKDNFIKNNPLEMAIYNYALANYHL